MIERRDEELLERAPSAAGVPLWLVALVLYAIADVFWLRALVPHPTTEILRGLGDGTSQLRDYWAAAHLDRTPFTFGHDPLNGAPEGRPLATAIQVAQAFQPGSVWVLHYVLGFVGAWNVFIFSGFFLTAWSTFLLLRSVGATFTGSLFGGYVFGFNPWAFERAQAGAPAFLHGWIFVALIAALFWSRQRRVLGSAAAGAAFAGSFYVASYFGLLALLIVLLFWVVDVFQAATRGALGQAIGSIGIVSASAAACLLPPLIAYERNSSGVDQQISNGAAQLQSLGSRIPEYFLPYGRNPLVGFVTRGYAGSGNFPEQTLFFGYSTMLLAAAAFAILFIRPRTLGDRTRYACEYFALLVPLAFVCSLPSHFRLLGLSLPMPSAFMSHVTTLWRVYARFGLLVGLGLAVLSGVALSMLERRTGLKWIGFVALGVLALEFLPGGVPAVSAQARPPDVRWLEAHPGGIVASYPAPTDKPEALFLAQSDYWYQHFHWHPLFGYFGSGTGGTREDGIRILTRYITDARTLPMLAAEHVEYVVLHDDVYEEEGAAPPAAPAGLQLVARFPATRIYRLDRGVAPADIDAELDQGAAEVALVQGLTAPAVSFGPGFTAAASPTAATFHGQGELRLRNDQTGLKRVQIIATVRSDTAHTLSLERSDGGVVASWPTGPAAMRYVFGPFAVGQGVDTFRFATDGSGVTVELSDIQVQAIADYSVSLR